MAFIVPPGGLSGFAQMTPATKARFGQAVRGNGGTRTAGRRRRRSKGSATKRTARARKSSGRKMKFGSPAWQKKYKVGKFRK